MLNIEIPEETVYAWSRRWPCSTLRGYSLSVVLDDNGDLLDYWQGPENTEYAPEESAYSGADATELAAILSDYLSVHNPGHPGQKSEPDPESAQVFGPDA